MSLAKLLEWSIAVKKQNDLGRDPVRPLVWRIAFPSMLAQFVSVLYSIVDRIYISNIPVTGETALAGVGVCGPVVTMLGAFAFLVGVGGAPLMSINMGAGRPDEARRILSNSFLVLCVCAIVLTAAVYPLRRPMLMFFGASEVTYPYADEYFSIYLAGTAFNLLSLGMNQFIICQGFAKKGMFSVVLGAALNIALDPVFIFAFDMGVAGAALATALSQLVSFCILAWLFLHGRSIVRVHVRCISKRPGLYGEILLVGFPTICRQGFASLSSALLNNAAAVYSDAAVAAVTISNKVYLLVRSIVIGIGQGFQPVAGYNFGAGDKKRTRQAFWFSVLLGTAVCIVCAAVISLFPDEIMHFFRDDAEVTRIGRQALLYACAVMPLMGYSTYVNQLYQCLGFHQAATLLASCRNGLLYVPLILILPRMLGLPGVEMSQPGADLLTFVVSLPFQIWFFRHKLR